MSSPFLTSIEVEGWMIDDGEVAHAKNPDDFWIPPKSDRESVSPGAIVKIRFYIRAPDESGNIVDHGERMWVEVKECIDGWYKGVLDNDPYCTNKIKSGQEVWFQPRHVIAIYQA